MPAKIITLSQKDQDLLRRLLNAIAWDTVELGLADRVSDLRKRVL